MIRFTSRSFARVFVLTLVTAGAVQVAADQQQTAPPPPPPTTTDPQTTQASSAQAPAPVTRPPLTPEQQALQAALRIQDPQQRLETLTKLKAEAMPAMARPIDDATLTLLLTSFKDRTKDINELLDRLMPPLPASATVETRLNSGLIYATRLVDAKVLLDRAEQIVAPPLQQFAKDEVATAMRTQAGRSNQPAPTDAAIQNRYGLARGRALEVLGRIHYEKGDLDRAALELTEAIELYPSTQRAPIVLAELEAKRGNDRAALNYYLLSYAQGRLKKAEVSATHELYKKVHGSDAGLEKAVDTLYNEKFPNPVKPEKYVPTAARTTRLVVAEMFTGSACPPCVSADLAMDALLERYPENAVVALAYHVHIPGPDPMVGSTNDARRKYYSVTGVPTFNVDGALAQRGGGPRENTQRNYTSYVGIIDKALTTAPGATVGVTAKLDGETIKVTATATPNAGVTGDLRLHIVLAERALNFTGENGIRHHTMVVRAAAGAGMTGYAVGSSGETRIDHTFDLATIRRELVQNLADEIAKRRSTETASATPREYRAEGQAMTEINPAGLVVVAFVQDGMRIHQGARVDVVAATPARGGGR